MIRMRQRYGVGTKTRDVYLYAIESSIHLEQNRPNSKSHHHICRRDPRTRSEGSVPENLAMLTCAKHPVHISSGHARQRDSESGQAMRMDDCKVC